MSKKNNDNSSNNSRANTKEKVSDDNSDSLVMEKGKKKSKKGSSKSIDEEEEDYLKLNVPKNAQTNKKVRRPRNSLVLYKDQLKFKKTKNGYELENNEEIKNNNDNCLDNGINVNDKDKEKNIISKSSSKIIQKSKSTSKNTKERKPSVGKKVLFMEPNFVTIIDVESYKKFNAENTSKDPYFDDSQDGKDNVKCSCLIF